MNIKEMQSKGYELELLEELILFNNNVATESLKRVPGGWIYVLSNPVGLTSAFIPFDNEFMITNKGTEFPLK